MRRNLWFSLATLVCLTSAAIGDDQPQPGTIITKPTPAPVAEPALVHEGTQLCGRADCTACHKSHGCGHHCEAARFRSSVPRGHCKAIARSMHEIADIAADVPQSFYEWSKKIKNTILDRGTCRTSRKYFKHKHCQPCDVTPVEATLPGTVAVEPALAY